MATRWSGSGLTWGESASPSDENRRMCASVGRFSNPDGTCHLAVRLVGFGRRSSQLGSAGRHPLAAH